MGYLWVADWAWAGALHTRQPARSVNAAKGPGAPMARDARTRAGKNVEFWLCLCIWAATARLAEAVESLDKVLAILRSSP
jgi:hypothetical protein